ncbi:MAG: galactose mutarotase [Clostridia bacterium]|nr:galactose mutarotase [Clostridia bacterium]
MNKRIFGTLPSGTPIEEYTLKSEGAEVSVITFGGAITRFVVDGIDVVLGFPTLEDYFEDHSHQGALIGRYGNRIAKGRFTLNGVEYKLEQNNGNNHLHGGVIGFDRKVWSVAAADGTSLALTLHADDMEEGYPGNLDVRVTYRLTGYALSIEYEAKSDKDTVCNLTNHSYFNLNGCGSGDVLNHVARIFADAYTEVDDELIPTGNRPDVTGTAFDFRAPRAIGERIAETGSGYDHNFILATKPPFPIAGYSLPPAAIVTGDKLVMSVYTDQRCVQFYTANFLSGDRPRLKGGAVKHKHAAFCLETQEEPDSPNRGGAILRAGDLYHTVTVYEVKPK